MKSQFGLIELLGLMAYSSFSIAWWSYMAERWPFVASIWRLIGGAL
jgi:hypothetical protein